MSIAINNLNRSQELDRKAKSVVVMDSQALKPCYALFRRLTYGRLITENLVYTGTAGVSKEQGNNGFLPAFRDRQTGRIEISRFKDGSPAPMHLLEGLPEAWIVARDASGKASAIKASVIAGFVHKSRFYTREEAANAVTH